MRKIDIYHVDAFTSKPFTGNAAGVVPDARDLSEDEMQNVAREMNLSETAFLMPAEHADADYKIRYFTPASEIDFCGHATIGTVWMMATQYGWAEKASRMVLETNIGLVPVEWEQGESPLSAVVMRQIAPQVKEVDVSPEEVAELLGIEASDLDSRYPVRLGYTGNWHLLVPVSSRAAIDRARPNQERLGELNRAQGAVTTHLFTFDSEGMEYDLYTRDFGPAVGIPEDPVTGSANGALSGYLILEGILDAQDTHKITIAQGDVMGRPGRLYVSISPSSNGPVIRVGGAAVPTIQGTLTLPE